MIANIKKLILGFIVSVALLSAIPAAMAGAEPAGLGGGAGQTTTNTNGGCGGVTFFPAWYDNGLCKDGKIVAPNSFDTGDSAKSFGRWASILALNLVAILLTAVGYVSLGFIIFGGFKYMTSGDNSSGTAGARKTITNAVIGLVLSIMSVAIVKFIAGAVGS